MCDEGPVLTDINFSPAARRTRCSRLRQLTKLLIAANDHADVHPLEIAGVNPWFRKRGLRTVRDVKSGKGTIVFEEFAGWTAAEKFFNLTPVQAVLLFSPRFIKGLSGLDQSKRILRFLQKVSSWYQL